MGYVAYYVNVDNKACVKYLSRGFACLARELPNEIAYACHSIGTAMFSYCDNEQLVEALINQAVKNGYLNETNREPHNQLKGGPFELVVQFKWGVESIVSKGPNPTIVRSYEKQIARNPKVVAGIYMRDSNGPLETIWSAE